jgi:hypothetical protein
MPRVSVRYSHAVRRHPRRAAAPCGPRGQATCFVSKHLVPLWNSLPCSALHGLALHDGSQEGVTVWRVVAAIARREENPRRLLHTAVEIIVSGEPDEDREARHALQYWLTVERLDRTTVHRRLQPSTRGDAAWQWVSPHGRTAMKVTVQGIMTSDSGVTEVVHDVAHVERDILQPETLGLTLAEAKALLEGVQQAMVTRRTEEYIAQHTSCPSSGRGRLRKGGIVMEMIRRRRTQPGHPDGHGWLPFQPCRRMAFHLAVVMFLVVEGALVAAQTGITHVHDQSVREPKTVSSIPRRSATASRRSVLRGSASSATTSAGWPPFPTSSFRRHS